MPRCGSLRSCSLTLLSARPSDAPPPNIVIGDPKAGQAYFAAKCSTCHSPTGDLKDIATRYPEPKNLQLAWVSGGAVGGRGGRGPSPVGPVRKPVTVTVTLPSGEKDPGVLLCEEGNVTKAVAAFAAALARHRHFERETLPPRV